MTGRAKKTATRDARHRNKLPQEWTPLRTGALRHVADGEGFTRPDVMAWLCNGKVVLQREVPSDTPEEKFLELFAEAQAAVPEAKPTSFRVPSQELAALLAQHNPGELPIVVATSLQRSGEEALDLAAQGDDRVLARWPLLHGGRVSAEQVGALVRRLWLLRQQVPWSELVPLEPEWWLEAPGVGLPRATLRVHGTEKMVSLGFTVEDRDGPAHFGPGQRPQGTRWIELLFHVDKAEDQALLAEAEAQGWRSEQWPEEAAYLTVWDVEGFPRPLVPSDLQRAEAMVSVVEALFARGEAAVPRGARAFEPLVVEGTPQGDLVARFRRLNMTPSEDVSPEVWADMNLPARSPSPAAPTAEHPLAALLRGAGTSPVEGLAERLRAEGTEALPSLLAALEDPASWGVARKAEDWFGPWVLLALGYLAEPSSLPRVLRFVATRAKDLGGMLAEDVPSLLAAFGPVAFSPLARIASSVTLEPAQRGAAMVALYLLGVAEPALRPAVTYAYEAFYRALYEDFDGKGELAHLMAEEAARLRDPAVDEAVRGAFERKRFARGLYELEDYERDGRAAAWSRRRARSHAPVAEKLRAPWWLQEG